MAQGGAMGYQTPDSLQLETTQPLIFTTRLHTRSSRRKKLNQYVKCERIGKGRHGEVYLCRDGHREVAIKAVKRSNPKDKIKLLRKTYQQQDESGPQKRPKLSSTENSIRKEIAVMKQCRHHPNLAMLYEVIDDPKEEKIYLIMEYLSGGPVEWSTQDDKPLLTLAQTRRVMRDVILGLEFMHARNILHRDIKPSNIMYTEDRRSVKLIDFGVSHIIYPPADKKRKLDADECEAYERSLFTRSDLLKRIGTPSFLAPEVVWFSDTLDLSSSASYDVTLPTSFESPSDTVVGSTFSMPKVRPPITKAVDIWALAVTFYCLLFGHTPFTGSSSSENDNPHHQEFMLYHQICNQDWTIDDVMGAERIPTGGRRPRDATSDGYLVVQLLEGMLQKDPRDRMPLSEVKKNPFILRDVYNAKDWLRLTAQESTESEPCYQWLKVAARKFVNLLSKQARS
ncbi:other/CAMKK/ELM protein kinase [Coprinopsis cinerea okayama7|uniref:Other/CAMKK/ELM protein kinase n=1 Tax=Coprinopsis cinerea (strain Okayama-7 / 130 / ATCC MYA-4618 / FGSC 9003) TaxID=240176 RepID=D6RL72_COPC7|nr:other/CAMKK/ELM protein kinase [Coprinopsis cinerea okayama7\|eukprot:XP_002911638.1 other/CAMKK/ELM protein kinase [Coprinopsis cinerea okayama7\